MQSHLHLLGQNAGGEGVRGAKGRGGGTRRWGTLRGTEWVRPSFCVYTVYNERTRTEVRDETTDGGTGEVTTVLGSDEDIEGSL